MNPQNDRIQQLIEEIDAMLDPGLWQSTSAWKQNVKKSQKLLKQVRNFLVSLGQHKLETDDLSQRQVQEQQKLQIAPMLAQLVEPWQEELENLQQQRQELLQEIRELERQRQYNYSLAQQYTKQEQIISEFSQALLGPVQDGLLSYLESITNLQQQNSLSTVPSEVSKQDEELFPDRRVSRRKPEEIKQEEDSFEWQREAKDDPQNLENPQSREFPSPRLGDRPKFPPDGEIYPYPGYEWFDTPTEEEEGEEIVREILETPTEESGKSILLANGKVEKVEEEEEVESSELNQTFLQLEEEEELEPDSNALLKELDSEAKGLLEELDSQAKEEEQETEIESKIKLEKTETTKENLKELSELFGELSQVEEKINGKTPRKESKNKEEKHEGKREKQEQQEYNKKSANARVEKEPFIQASADENLLPTEEPIEEKKDLELLLNDKTIEELVTDLAQLEEANLEDEGNYLEDYDWENTVIQTDSENTGIEASFSRKILGEAEEEESENAFILEVSSEEEEDVASFEDFLANISDFSQQINDAVEEEEISLEASEERTLEEILASLTSGDETPAEDREDDEEEKMTLELLELEVKMKEDKN